MRAPPALLLLLALFAGGCGSPPRTVPLPAAEPKTTEISILFRRQFAVPPRKENYFRHVDMLLADGSVVGFYRPEGGNPVLFAAIGWHGAIHRNDWMTGDNAFYADIEAAKNCRRGRGGRPTPFTTLRLRLRVSEEQAAVVAEEWRKIEEARPSFRLVNRNCVTRAAQVLAAAGLLPGGVPGVETPGNLLRELRRVHGTLDLEEGFFGYRDGRPVLEPE